ncbi:MAG: hypothetical protein ABW155_18740 [Candidatus Thiodiazotropha sp.]
MAIAAIQGHKTVNEIASRIDVHPTQVSAWKKALLAHSVEASTRENAKTDKDEAKDLDSLYHKIGRLEMENDFLKK